MSCAWNNYCVAVKHKIGATKAMHHLGENFLKEKDPQMQMLGEMIRETSLYYYLDGLVFERDNYITLIGDDMERNGDGWIVYMAGQLRDKNMLEWLRVYMRIPFELKEEWKSMIRADDYEYEKRAGRG